MKIVSICLAASISLAGTPGDDKPVGESVSTMGTIATVTVRPADRANLPSYIKSASGNLKRLEGLFSIYNPDSELSRLNDSAGQSFQQVSSETIDLLNITRRFNHLSKGCFDPTILPFMELWGLKKRIAPADVPTAASISNALAVIGYRHLEISNNTARLAIPGCHLDLGGIAKGYAVDICFSNLIALGAADFMVDLGGNIRCMGAPSENRPWTIGVRNPYDKNQIIGTIRLLSGMATATSGNYERFITINGKRYCHIIDPRTGYPVEGMAGVTVISPTAVESDAMSTSLFVLGMKESAQVLDELKTTEALFIPDSEPLTINATPGMMKFFTPATNMTVKVLH